MENKLTPKKQERLKRDAEIRARHKELLDLGYMKTVAVEAVANFYGLKSSRVYLIIKRA